MNDFLVVDTLPKLKDLADRWKEREFALDTEFTDLSYYKQDLIGISLYSDRHDIPAVFIQFNFKDTYTQKEKTPDGGRAKIDIGYVYEKTDAIDKQEALPYLKKIIDGADCVTANGKVEIKALHKYGISINIKDDVNLMNHLLDVSSKSDLKTAGRKYLKIDMKSYEETVGMKVGNINWNKVDWEAYAEYGAKDAWVTWKLREVFRKQVEEDEPLLHCYEKLELPLIPKVAESEIAGVYIDKSVLQEMSGRIAEDIKRSEEAIFNEVGVEFNLGSPKQLAEILFDRLGLPVISETASGGRSTGEDAMKELAFMGYDIAEKILDYRRLSKLQTTYIDKIPDMVDGDGRLRGSFNQSGTQCITGNSIVVTDKGMIPIKYCDKDTVVLNMNTDLEQSVDYVKYEQVPTYYIRTNLGFEIEGTNKHKIITNRYKFKDYGNNSHTWRRLDEVKVGDRIKIPFGYNVFGLPNGEYHSINFDNINRNKTHKSNEFYIQNIIDEDFAEFIGIYNADGSIKDDNGSFNIRISNTNIAVKNRVCELSRKLFGVEAKVYETETNIINKNLAQIEDLLCLGRYDYSKTIPDVIMRSSENVIKAYLKGLNLDGHIVNEDKVKKSFFKLTITNEQHTLQVHTILTNLGIISSRRRIKGRNYSTICIYNQHGYKYINEVGSVKKQKEFKYKTGKAHGYRLRDGYIEVGIKHIEHRFSDVYDFVLPQTHSFIANSIINHNTGRFSSSNPNLQNIVNDKIYPVKRAFVAKKGYSLLVFDWCIAEGSEVLTKQGAKPIEMCVAGDEVLQEDGTYRKVLSVPYRGEKRVVRLTTSCGYDIVATDEHRFRVIDINGEYVWKKIKDIDVNNDFIAIQPTTSRPEGARLELPEVSYTHYNNKELKNTPKILDEDLAFFMGYISGDGCLTQSNRSIGWVVNEKDKSLAEYLENLVFKLFGEKPRCSGIHNGAYQYYFNSAPLLNWLRLIGVSKDNISELLMFSDLSVVKSWLRGYFEADGYGGRRVSICSSRESIIKQTQKLLLQIGIFCKYKKQKNGEFIKNVLTIPTNYTGLFLQEVGFFSQRKIVNTLEKAGNFGISPVYGGHPNLKSRIDYKDNLGLQYYLRNTKFRGGVISRKLAEKIKMLDESEYNRLGLFKILDWGQVYDKVSIVEDFGVAHTYDLEVEDTHSFIVNGFISHNSTIEIRIMAHESKDPVMIKILKEYRDVHQETADNISAQTGLHLSRSIGKTLNFAILYGMGADALAYTLNKSMRGEVKKGTMTQEEYEVSQIDQRTAQKMIDGFYSAYAGFTEWSKLEVQNTKKTGWVYTLGGRRRPVPELQNKKTYNAGVRKCVNSIVQGGAGDLMKLAIIKLSNMYKEKGYDATTLLYIHDEIVIEVRNDQAEKCKEDVRWLMENIFPACDVPILCEGDIYKSWDGLKGGETHNSIGQSSNSLFNFLKFNKLIFK